MLKAGVTNYLKSCKYFLVPLGSMFLGVLAGISALSWRGFPLSPDWMKSLIDFLDLDFIFAFTSAGAGEREFLVVFFLMLGFFIGLYLLRYLIWHQIAQHSLKEFVAHRLLHSLLSAAGVVLSTGVVLLWPGALYLFPLLLLLFEDALSLLKAYFRYAYKKVPFREVYSLKSAALLTLTNTVVILLSAAVTFLAALAGPLLALFTGLTFVSIAIIVTGVNAGQYVRGVVAAHTETT